MLKKTKQKQDGYIVLYHKAGEEHPVKMTKSASLKAAQRSAWRFERIGIAPCEVVKVIRSKKKLSKRK
tara:strand:- start:600 stop:803 length:204 start_codon:yes stop_codon:yes gene_type:complete